MTVYYWSMTYVACHDVCSSVIDSTVTLNLCLSTTTKQHAGSDTEYDENETCLMSESGVETWEDSTVHGYETNEIQWFFRILCQGERSDISGWSLFPSFPSPPLYPFLSSPSFPSFSPLGSPFLFSGGSGYNSRKFLLTQMHVGAF